MSEATAEGTDNLGPSHVEIIVNGRPKPWDAPQISFDELVHLAYPNPPPPPPGSVVVYTITYTKGPHSHPQGTLLEGQSVPVKGGMVFDVVRTIRS